MKGALIETPLGVTNCSLKGSQDSVAETSNFKRPHLRHLSLTKTPLQTQVWANRYLIVSLLFHFGKNSQTEFSMSRNTRN